MADRYLTHGFIAIQMAIDAALIEVSHLPVTPVVSLLLHVTDVFNPVKVHFCMTWHQPLCQLSELVTTW